MAGDGNIDGGGAQIKPKPGTTQSGERVVRIVWEICDTIKLRMKRTIAMAAGHFSKTMHILPTSHRRNLSPDIAVLAELCRTSSQSTNGSRGARDDRGVDSPELGIVELFNLCCGRFWAATVTPGARRFLGEVALDRGCPAGLEERAKCSTLLELVTSSQVSSPSSDMKGIEVRRLSSCVIDVFKSQGDTNE